MEPFVKRRERIETAFESGRGDVFFGFGDEQNRHHQQPVNPQVFKNADFQFVLKKPGVPAMRKHHVKRLLCITSQGVEETDPSFLWFYNWIFKPLYRRLYADMKRSEEYLLSAGDIDWTVVRPTALTDNAPRGKYRVSPRFAPHGGLSIARGDVAHFIVNQLPEKTYIHGTPTLAD
ncbi:MAG: NAD(P)H-binding protein [Candidatus Firestonebacteria bacterium]|nr:NAD(P)H-binding protein [Candidatus Firestonebacteria bacterium]